MCADLLLHEVRLREKRSAACLVKCLVGDLELGDVLDSATNGDIDLKIRLEVGAISIFDGVLVDTLEQGYNAVLELAGDLPLEVDNGWQLHVSRTGK